MSPELKAIADGLIVAVKGYVARLEMALTGRIEAVERSLASLPPPKDGKDADPEVVRSMVAEAVAALPKPEAGKDADPAVIIRAAAEAVAALPRPADGKSVTIDEVAPLIAEQVKAAVDAIPRPRDGNDANPEDIARAVKEALEALPKPADGKSVTVDELLPVVAELVDKAVAALPVPKHGQDADPEMVAALVKEAVAALPVAPAGKDADPELIRAMVAEAVAAIPKPKDGEPGKSFTIDDVRGLLEAEQAKWALEFERRAQDTLQRAIDKFPAPKDGRDAFELEDLSVEHDGDGGVTLKFTRGELVKEFTLQLPRFKVKGGYREGVDYREGDGVSFGGSFHIALKDAPQGKPGESDDWHTAAKKGRDGKDAKAPELPVRDVVRLK